MRHGSALVSNTAKDPGPFQKRAARAVRLCFARVGSEAEVTLAGREATVYYRLGTSWLRLPLCSG